MTEPVDFEKNQKDKTWIWVAAGAGVLILCCGLLIVAVGAGLYLNSRGALPVFGATATPTRRPATAVPQATERPQVPEPSEITIEPLDPGSIPLGVYGIYDLIPGYQGQTEPGVNIWQTSFAYDQALVIFTGWCTIDEATLDQNFEHISYLLEIDGTSVPTEDLYWEDAPGNDGICRSFYGVVQAWPVGEHVIVLTMRFEEDLNDGWGDYSAGDYVDRFELTVTP
jgi:hypothetical protein